MIIEIPDIKKLPFILAYYPFRGKIKHKGRNSYSYVITNTKIPHEPGIYFLYDKNKKLIYIGETQCLFVRISSHRKGIAPTYLKFFTLDSDRAYREGIEHILISKLKPRLQEELF